MLVKPHKYLNETELNKIPLSLFVLYEEQHSNSQLIMPSLERLSARLKNNVIIYLWDREKFPELFSNYRIKETPTILFFKRGWLVDQIRGVANRNEIFASIKKILISSN